MAPMAVEFAPELDLVIEAPATTTPVVRAVVVDVSVVLMAPLFVIASTQPPPSSPVAQPNDSALASFTEAPTTLTPTF